MQLQCHKVGEFKAMHFFAKVSNPIRTEWVQLYHILLFATGSSSLKMASEAAGGCHYDLRLLITILSRLFIAALKSCPI